jgi:hypothetical protein
MRVLRRSFRSGPLAIAICCALLTGSIAGSAAAGVNPLTAVKKQLKRSAKIARAADKNARLALQGPLVVSTAKDDGIGLSTGSFATVLSVNLHKGKWVIEGATQVNNNSGKDGARDDCRLAFGASTLTMRSTGIGPATAGDYSAIIPLSHVLNLSADATISLQCQVASTSSATSGQLTENSTLMATRVR